MDQRYENGGQWVYVNGELYHAGIKGMKWGKHLPGTDWWKETTSKYYQQNNVGAQRVKDVDEKGKTTFRTSYGNNANLGQRVKANAYAAGQAAKIYGRKARLAGKIVTKKAKAAVSRGAYKVAKGTSKLWNQAKGFGERQIKEFKDKAKKAYDSKKSEILKFFYTSDRTRHSSVNMESTLDSFVNKQLDEATKAYVDAVNNRSSGNMINSFIQTAQFRVASGVNNYLKSIGLDDDVDRFMRKLKKQSLV